jgi:hypothetical protein
MGSGRCLVLVAVLGLAALAQSERVCFMRLPPVHEQMLVDRAAEVSHVPLSPAEEQDYFLDVLMVCEPAEGGSAEGSGETPSPEPLDMKGVVRLRLMAQETMDVVVRMTFDVAFVDNSFGRAVVSVDMDAGTLMEAVVYVDEGSVFDVDW